MDTPENTEFTGSDSGSNTEKVSGIERIRMMLDSALDSGWCNCEYDPYESCFRGQFHEFENVFILWQITPGCDCFRTKCIAVGNPEDDSKMKDLQQFCNEWNAADPFPEAYIDDVSGELVTKAVMKVENDVDEEFIRENLLPDLFNANIKFFEEAFARNLISKNLWVTDRQEQ